MTESDLLTDYIRECNSNLLKTISYLIEENNKNINSKINDIFAKQKKDGKDALIKKVKNLESILEGKSIEIQGLRHQLKILNKNSMKNNPDDSQHPDENRETVLKILKERVYEIPSNHIEDFLRKRSRMETSLSEMSLSRNEPPRKSLTTRNKFIDETLESNNTITEIEDVIRSPLMNNISNNKIFNMNSFSPPSKAESLKFDRIISSDELLRNYEMSVIDSLMSDCSDIHMVSQTQTKAGRFISNGPNVIPTVNQMLSLVNEDDQRTVAKKLDMKNMPELDDTLANVTMLSDMSISKDKKTNKVEFKTPMVPEKKKVSRSLSNRPIKSEKPVADTPEDFWSLDISQIESTEDADSSKKTPKRAHSKDSIYQKNSRPRSINYPAQC